MPNYPLLAQNALIPYRRTTPDCSKYTRRCRMTVRGFQSSASVEMLLLTPCRTALHARRTPSFRVERLGYSEGLHPSTPNDSTGRNECLFNRAARPFSVLNDSLMEQNAFIPYRTTTPFAEAAPIHTELPQGPHMLLA